MAPPFDPLDQALLITNKGIFQDWETVWVQHQWSGSKSLFRFTAVEREPIPALWDKLQFVPGDQVEITLGGQQALEKGFIGTRQVAYDKENHAIELQGESFTGYVFRSSVDTPDGNFDGKNFEQVAREVLAKYQGISIRVIADAGLNPRPFTSLQNEKGETTWDFLERIARARGIVLGSDFKNNVLLIGDHTFPVATRLVEGVNIESCQAIISIQNLYDRYMESGQSNASDDNAGTAASEMEKEASGSGPPTSTKITPAPFPVRGDDELQEMANNEAVWSEGTKVQATIVTRGWMMPGTQKLWQAGDNVFVQSPMAIINQVMSINTVTFTQDQRGTLTTLDLVIPWLLRDKSPAGANFPADPTTLPPKPPPPEFTGDQPSPVPPPQPKPEGFKWPYPRRR